MEDTAVVTEPITDTQEPIVETAPPPEVPKEKDSARFAALAKRERALQQSAQALKAKEQEIQDKYKAYEDYQSKLKSAKDNPLGVLEAAGLSYDDLTEYVLNDHKPTPNLEMKKLRDELNDFKKQQQNLIESEKQKISQEQTETLNRFYEDNKNYAKANKDKYELLNLEEHNLDLISEKIESYYKETLESGTPRILSPQEACDLVEKELEDRVTKYLASNKLKQKVSPPVVTDELTKGDIQQAIDSQAKTSTLSNKMTAATQTPQPKKYMTEQERLNRAIAKMEELSK